jgi:hypothetical protein
MKNKNFRLAVTLILVFVLGIGLGMWLSNYSVKTKVEQLNELRTPKGFEKRIVETTNLSGDGKEKLLPIIQLYAKRRYQLWQDSHVKNREMLDSFKMECKPYLKPEQQSALEESLKIYLKKQSKK